jgi:cell division protease FtsH
MAKPTDPNQIMRQAQPSFWQMLLLILLVVGIAGLVANALKPGPQELSYTQFKGKVREGAVAEVTFRGDHIRGRFKPKEGEGKPNKSGEAGRSGGKNQTEGRNPNGEPFVTTKPRVEDPELLTLLQKQHVTINAVSPQATWWQQAIVGVLPWLLILGVFLYFMRRAQQQMMGEGSAVRTFHSAACHPGA